jgi:hypothetical protein
MNRSRTLLLLLAGLLAWTVPPLASPAVAQVAVEIPQPSDTAYEVRLGDGTVHVGQIIRRDADRLVLRTRGGVEVSVPTDRIVRIRVAEGRFVDGAYWPHDPNDSRLFFGPTGRTLEAGDGYVAMYQLFFPFVGYGATDWLTLAGGTPIFPGIIGEAFYLAPKARVVNAPQAEVSVGVMAVFLTRELDQGSAGLVYGTGTFGSRDSAITGGAALHFFTGGDDPLLGSEPVLMLGGEHRVGRSIKLISENYLIPTEEVGALSGGVRFFGERLSADGGLAIGFGSGGAECCLPLLNFVYNFGGGR